MENKPNVKLKTFTYYIKQKKQKNILDWMTKISKNIFNCTLFVNKIYTIYQNDIYKELYDYIIKNNLEKKFINKPKEENKQKKKYNKKAKKEKKDEDIKNIENQFYLLFDKYYNFYIKNKSIIDSNNKIIYKHIINDITESDIIISNKNYKLSIDNYLEKAIELKNISFNQHNKLIVIDNIVNSIIKSLYIKNYFYIKKQLENKKEVDEKYKNIVDTINKNEYIYNDENVHWRDKIIKSLNISKLSSIENFINRLTYKYLGDNKEKLPSDVIINIISAKTNMAKFLDKDARFNLFYYFRSFSILEDGIRLNVGNYIHKKYNDIIKNNYKNYYEKNKKYYYNENNLIELSKTKLKENKNKGIKYTKINKNSKVDK